VGSAQTSLFPRLERHYAKKKERLHWHIDYLTTSKTVRIKRGYLFFLRYKGVRVSIEREAIVAALLEDSPIFRLDRLQTWMHVASIHAEIDTETCGVLNNWYLQKGRSPPLVIPILNQRRSLGSRISKIAFKSHLRHKLDELPTIHQFCSRSSFPKDFSTCRQT
jgi:hypothetical protein